MILSELPFDQYHSALRSTKGLPIKTGPFSVRIHSKIDFVINNLYLMYENNLVAEQDEFIDFHVSVKKPAGIRNHIKPQVQFYYDGSAPFKPLPFLQAFPMLEWGLNLCASSTANQFLIIHAAVVESNGIAVILPGPSGSGKSTLCAALVSSGWRLLSDELTLIHRETGLIQPLVRPVSLKNQSIDIIQNKYPENIFTNVTRDTAKGTIAHMRAPKTSIDRVDLLAKAGFIVFPKYISGSTIKTIDIPRGRAFMSLIDNSFNYSLLGEAGFRVMSKTLHNCNCSSLEYSNLDDALQFLSHMVAT